MNITQVGIDLAKLVFQIHGVDARGKVALRKQLKRSQVGTFFAQLAPCAPAATSKSPTRGRVKIPHLAVTGRTMITRFYAPWQGVPRIL
jgi:transposase